MEEANKGPPELSYMRRGKATVVIVVVIVAIAAVFGIASISPSVANQPIIRDVMKYATDSQPAGASDNVTTIDTYEADTKVTTATKTVTTSRTVDLLSETYYLAAGEKRVISFTTAEARSAYLAGTGKASGGGITWLYITTDEGKCPSLGCTKEVIRGPNNPMKFSNDAKIKLTVYTGSSQQLVIDNTNNSAISLTLDLDIVYIANTTVDASEPDTASVAAPPEPKGSLFDFKEPTMSGAN